MATSKRPSRPTRTPTSRPRRVAGQPSAPTPGATPVENPVEVPAEVPVEVPVEASVDSSADGSDETVTEASPDTPGPVVDLAEPAPAAAEVSAPDDDGAPPRVPLVALVVAVVVLLAIGIAEVVYLRSGSGGDGGGAAAASAERPVQLSELTVRSVVDQAATAADTILSASSADYDGQVDAAVATMTDAFAEEYRTTKADVKEQFLAEQAEVTIDVSAQGVIKATADELQALVFLTQSTRKGAQGGVTPVQYRVTVTMVDTGEGWLVSDLQAL